MTLTTSTPQAAPAPVAAPRALLKALEKNFPVFRDTMPLAIGIDKQILAHMPQTERPVLRTALRMHTKSFRYLKAMAKATVRFNLDGSTADEVTQTHRDHATTLLQERAKKETQLRQEQEAQRKLDEAASQRAEKLNQLAAKFSRS